MSGTNSPHTFYIPVMGTGFTIDSALSVAKYGISSVISLVDDCLIEQMRKYWCEKHNEPYTEIATNDEDARARRITAYLNLLNKIVEKQVADLRTSPFAPNSEITKYFEMLPNTDLKQRYQKMLAVNDPQKKTDLQDELRQAITTGSIDVNIMTKLDFPKTCNGQTLPYECCDGASALRGYANSDLSSYITFSAGFNPHLFGYTAKFNDFFPDAIGNLKKKICLKVSDFRSAAIQGKYLAKHGLWVSEYRIESPLNCGGHAFINDGQLLGLTLDEFKRRKNELIDSLHGFYKKALQSLNKFCTDLPNKVRITAQGGVGTNEEHQLLMEYYELDAIGWGTPFLLVPEVTNVAQPELRKLIAATSDDVFLSSSSPLGVPFWNLRTSASEKVRCKRISENRPGSCCIKGYAKLSKEFSERALCVASREYQILKLRAIEKINLAKEQLIALKNEILSKSCICHDLAGGATIKKNIDPNATEAICPGPNIINFKKIATLKEMVNHIYGRCSLLMNTNRPHMFIREAELQINYLLAELKNASLGLPARSQQKMQEVKDNLYKSIEYYQNSAMDLFKKQHEKFLQALENLKHEIDSITLIVAQQEK